MQDKLQHPVEESLASGSMSEQRRIMTANLGYGKQTEEFYTFGTGGESYNNAGSLGKLLFG